MKARFFYIPLAALCVYSAPSSCITFAQQDIPAPISQEEFECKLSTASCKDIKDSIGVLEMLVGSLMRQVETMRSQHGERGAIECCKLLNSLFQNSLTSITNASRTIENEKGKALLIQKLRTLPAGELLQLQHSLTSLIASLEKADFNFKDPVQRYIKALFACIDAIEKERAS